MSFLLRRARPECPPILVDPVVMERTVLRTGQLCEMCMFFAPARGGAEKPAWGQCMKLVEGKSNGPAGKPRPLFTWADNHCDDFQARPPCSSRQETAAP